MSGDTVFAGSIPRVYDELLVPLIFEPYAAELAARVAAHRPARVLELAAGTGVVTRRLAQTLAPDAAIVATDINDPMLAQAAAIGTTRPVEWRPADAMALPFDDGSFDAVVCQFGVMFFPDKPAAFAEARRVLRGGGRFHFNVWDRIEDNEFAFEVTEALGSARFLARVPHGYFDRETIARDLAAAGFASPEIETIAARSRAASPEVPAIAYCHGTPLRNELADLDAATRAAAAAVARRFGSGAVDGKIQAHVVSVAR